MVAAPYQTFYTPRVGRVGGTKRLPPSSLSEPQYDDLTSRAYDASGNVDWGGNEVTTTAPDGSRFTSRYARSRSYYGADERLRYHQEQVLVSSGTSVQNLGVWEEYRYDPLGRRVLVRSNRDDLCDQPDQCFSHVTRYVWSGDQVLWELRAEGGNGARLDTEAGSGAQNGRVSYFHAGGIDRPLVIMKNDTSIIPHQNWRGQFAFGTYANGQVSDCNGWRSPCSNVPWAGFRTTAWHVEANAPDIRNWYGGLVDGMRDASGQMYMRNRYYDPATGQFTQTDPIGIAGGLNAYGFAAGDPVTYSDPYGLYIIIQGSREYRQRVLRALAYVAGRSETFRDIHNLFAASRRVHIRIGADILGNDCSAPGCHRSVPFQGISLIQVRDDIDGDLAFAEVLAHEIIHAAGAQSRRLPTNVPLQCAARLASTAHACTEVWDQQIKQEIEDWHERARAVRALQSGDSKQD